MQQYQGDIGIIEIQDCQLKFSALPTGGVIVAEGEVTGHKHVIVAEPDSLVEIAQDERGYFLKVNKGQAVMQHVQHGVQTIERGLWFIPRQVEFDEGLEYRNVSD